MELTTEELAESAMAAWVTARHWSDTHGGLPARWYVDARGGFHVG